MCCEPFPFAVSLAVTLAEKDCYTSSLIYVDNIYVYANDADCFCISILKKLSFLIHHPT